MMYGGINYYTFLAKDYFLCVLKKMGMPRIGVSMVQIRTKSILSIALRPDVKNGININEMMQLKTIALFIIIILLLFLFLNVSFCYSLSSWRISSAKP